jgi:hypothetical protein
VAQLQPDESIRDECARHGQDTPSPHPQGKS